MKLIAFLRGINVGGKHLVKMTDLKRLLESAGMTTVRTIQTSGNVIFESTISQDAAVKKITRTLEQEFVFPIPMIVRSGDEIASLIDVNPFRKVKVGDQTRMLVSFLADKSEGRIASFAPPPFLSVVYKDEQTICIAFELSKGAGTPEVMAVLDKHFGKGITTRSWQTVQKCNEI